MLVRGMPLQSNTLVLPSSLEHEHVYVLRSRQYRPGTNYPESSVLVGLGTWRVLCADSSPQDDTHERLRKGVLQVTLYNLFVDSFLNDPNEALPQTDES
jgi:hypothetical protein